MMDKEYLEIIGAQQRLITSLSNTVKIQVDIIRSLQDTIASQLKEQS